MPSERQSENRSKPAQNEWVQAGGSSRLEMDPGRVNVAWTHVVSVWGIGPGRVSRITVIARLNGDPETQGVAHCASFDAVLTLNDVPSGL